MNHDNRRRISEATRADLTARFSALDENRDPFGRDDPAADAEVEQIFAGLLHADGLVAQHYERKAPGFLAAYQAVSFLPELARIAENAIAADRQMIDGEFSGPFVILTTRPGDRFVLDDANVLDAAISMADQYGAVCDLQCSYGGSGYCIEDMQFSQRHKLDGSAYMDKHGRMINRPFTFPFAHGEYVVLSRICIDCWIDFVKRYEIKDVRIQNPWETLG
ncbi:MULTISPECIES: hypothetical protein [Mycolicibacterium]|uniref:Uncharacterized protein n=1 Tax=Mycolicibacterium senegalense TaxID=1796 RepID=A0ABR5FN35_9MYCO|nr:MULTISPECIES: hypothetical protein [Mycolicibacterium]KLI07890.1 hypothetical protein AA982_12305 [Mycolicibacterium senegalense]KLO48248.1 hypothetical protein ABW05_26430 [Mycolicibacterium senegalense]OBJ97102.1 hypothetical protein A5639_30750 [Mycolicibacterium conceptionense]OMB68203.1 hypothetical protein A5741_09965 [Mycolicibacterium conceptionense]OMB88582.1 hypothetical protein A5746_24195 [Mycolicibacterium conceptionense]